MNRNSVARGRMIDFAAEQLKIIGSSDLNVVPSNEIPKDRVVIQRYDGSTGEASLVVDRAVQFPNGSGFVLSYSDKVIELLRTVQSGACLRVFFLIAHKQQYCDSGIFGWRASLSTIREELGLNRKTVYESLRWLRENFIVLESKIDGQSEFMVNPNYVTIGRDKKARLAEWNRRWLVFNATQSKKA